MGRQATSAESKRDESAADNAGLAGRTETRRETATGVPSGELGEPSWPSAIGHRPWASSGRPDSNRRPPAPKLFPASAIPAEYGNVPTSEDPYIGLSQAVWEHNVEHAVAAIVEAAR